MRIDKQLRRAALFERNAVDEEARTVEISFSSEISVERWFGMEILSHDESAVDLSRLNNRAPVLEDHFSRQIGVVEKAWIADRKGHASLRFSKNPQGEEVFKDILDGIRSNVSVGYQVKKFEVDEESNPKIYRAVKWMPFEISIVSIPADSDVGVGRSLSEAEAYEPEIVNTKRGMEEPSNDAPAIFAVIV